MIIAYTLKKELYSGRSGACDVHTKTLVDADLSWSCATRAMPPMRSMNDAGSYAPVGMHMHST
jgi:hypothetical protein